MANFGPKLLVNPFEVFPLFELFFYRLQRLFLDEQYRKRHFPALYCPKKKVGKTAIFGSKPWVNPFEKMSIFWLFEVLIFMA